MRKKFAMRWRREALRRGAVISNEGMVFSKKELREEHLQRKDNGYKFDAEYKGFKWLVCADDALDAYRIFVEEIDYEDECIRKAVDKLNSIPERYELTKEERAALAMKEVQA